MTEAKFCDISNHQPSTRAYIQAIKDWGAKAVVLKVTEGNNFIDPTAQAKKALVESMGMLCHAYHFSHFTTSAEAKAEAKYFSDRCNALGYDKNKTVMVNDVEAGNLPQNKATLTRLCNVFSDELLALGWKKVDTYSNSSWYQDRLNQNSLKANNFWCASYGAPPNKNYPTVKFNAWQYAADPQYGGAVYLAGVPTDCNIDYNGFYTADKPSPSKPSGEIKEPTNVDGKEEELKKLFDEILADAQLKKSTIEYCTSILAYASPTFFDKPPFI